MGSVRRGARCGSAGVPGHPGGQYMGRLTHWIATGLAVAGLGLLGACTPASLALTVVGVATDTSMTWTIVKHLHAKATEGDPVWCIKLNSVERALSPRCGEFVAGSIRAGDIGVGELQECPLTVAARDPRLWPVLPELLDKGARPRACAESPLQVLAQAHPCPDFAAAPAAVVGAFQSLAETDPRAVRHDVVRLLSCPAARSAGLHRAIDRWLAAGALQPGRIGFGLLGALHPDYLVSPEGRRLEARGHTASASLGAFEGRLPGGFEEALRTSHWQALDWWLQRLPQLAERVPPRQGNQVHWLPLARVLVPSFLERPETQADMVRFLLARGADPGQALPYDPSHTVLSFARQIGSPHVGLLDPAVPTRPLAATIVAAGDGRGGIDPK